VYQQTQVAFVNKNVEKISAGTGLHVIHITIAVADNVILYQDADQAMQSIRTHAVVNLSKLVLKIAAGMALRVIHLITAAAHNAITS
jgi:hypothetical protein